MTKKKIEIIIIIILEAWEKRGCAWIRVGNLREGHLHQETLVLSLRRLELPRWKSR